MALSTEETAELRDAYSNLGADELRAQLGDDAEHDTIIQSLLDAGKQVELKGAATVGGAAADVLPAVKANTNEEGEGDDDDDDGITGFVDEHGRPVPDPNGAAAGAHAAAAQAAAQAEADAAAAAAAAAADPAAKIAPLDLSFLDQQFKDQQAALDTEKGVQFQKMMDGEISPAEYNAYETQYLNDRDQLKVDKAATAEWYGQIHGFKQQALVNSGINYDADPAKQTSWDTWVRHLAKTQPGHNDAWYLEQAHKKVMVEFDVAPRAAGQKGTIPAVAAKKVGEKQGRAPDLSGIPPTIGALPAATSLDGGDGGEFAHLDNLTGMAFERALAGLTADQKARYEAS